jgi:hypothetical protein
MVTAVGDENGLPCADVIAPPFKVKESAKTKASNILAILVLVEKVLPLIDHRSVHMAAPFLRTV